VPLFSKAKAKASIVDDEDLKIINLGYLTGNICERRRISLDDELPPLSPLTELEDLIDEGNYGLAALEAGRSSRMRPAVDYKT
jgi:hypothetical protein